MRFYQAITVGNLMEKLIDGGSIDSGISIWDGIWVKGFSGLFSGEGGGGIFPWEGYRRV